MIQIRDVLQVKFGKIDQAVELFTKPEIADPAAIIPGRNFEVLTDISGEMYTLVNEFVVENLADYEQVRSQQLAHPQFDRWFMQFQLFVEGGRRELYNVEGAYDVWSRPGVVVARETYRAYQWQIREAVDLLKRYGGMLEAFGVGQNSRIVTDLSGPMFQAIIEIETDSPSGWESRRREMYREVEFQVWFNQMMTRVEAGSHEFFRVEHASG